jgi:hypothetical protein
VAREFFAETVERAQSLGLMSDHHFSAEETMSAGGLFSARTLLAPKELKKP